MIPRPLRDRVSRTMFDVAAAFTPRRPDASPRVTIGVFLLWGIGDAVLTTPFLRALRATYPNARIMALGKPWLVELFTGESLFDDFVTLVPPWTRHSGKYRLWSAEWRDFARGVRTVRDTRFDLLVSLRPDPRETLLARALAAREFAGYAAVGGRAWVTIDLSRGVADEPALYRGALAARAAETLLGVSPGSLPALRDMSALKLRQKLSAAGYAGGPVLAVAFGAAHPIRRWNGPQIAETIGKLHRRPGAVLVVEANDSPRIELRPGIPTLRWRGPLAELKRVLALADVLFCTDSGALHVGTAVGCRTVSVFGPGALGRFAPPGPTHAAYAVEPMPCRPCHDNCIHPAPLCMDRIDTGALAALLDDALAHVSAPRAQCVAERIGA